MAVRNLLEEIAMSKKPRAWNGRTECYERVGGHRQVFVSAVHLNARDAESLAKWLIKAAAWAREKEGGK